MEHGSILNGNIRPRWVSSQWQSTHDEQLARRFYSVEFTKLHPVVDGPNAIDMAALYASRVDLMITDVGCGDLPARLVKAANCEFGLVVELIIAAIEEALYESSNALTREHFAAAFRRRTDCIDYLNPFINPDFMRLDTSPFVKTEVHQ